MRYFFNISADDVNVTDFVGAELKDLDAVRVYAAAQLEDIWAQRVLAGQPPLSGWLEVVDSVERAVLSLPL